MSKDNVASLIGGLIGDNEGNTKTLATNKNARKVAKGVPPTSQQTEKPATERVCVVVESEVLDKVRSIADKEGISLSSIYNLGLKVVLENYETTHGKVSPKVKKKGNVDSVFNI